MDVDPAHVRAWPLFGLRVRTPRLELRYPSDEDLMALVEASADIHDVGEQPFPTPWSALPEGERSRALLAHHWGCRSNWSVDSWRLELVAVVDGQVLGSQGLIGRNVPVRRTVESASWLARAAHGRGIGTEMRHAILQLAFAGLGVQRAESCAYEGNDASVSVTRKLGYEPNGTMIQAVDGVARRELQFAMERTGWDAIARPDIEIVGLDACAGWFSPYPGA